MQFGLRKELLISQVISNLYNKFIKIVLVGCTGHVTEIVETAIIMGIKVYSNCLRDNQIMLYF